MSHQVILNAARAGELLTGDNDLPTLVRGGGAPARTAWDDFFQGRLCNRHTRLCYERAVRCFLGWAHAAGKRELHEITAGDVGRYLAGMGGGLAKKKQHLSALRRYFNLQVERHICLLNPAAVAETERLSVVEGRTPNITPDQAGRLYRSIDVSGVTGLRDRAIIATLNFTGARAGAVGRLRLKDYYDAGDQWMLLFWEKGNKSRQIPVSHDLKQYLDADLDIAGLREEHGTGGKEFLFRTARGRENRLTDSPMTSDDIGRMLKRRLRDAGLPARLTPHSFRVAVATDLDDQAVRLEEIQHLLGHSDPRTTKVYIRNKQKVARNLVERIRVGR